MNSRWLPLLLFVAYVASAWATLSSCTIGAVIFGVEIAVGVLILAAYIRFVGKISIAEPFVAVAIAGILCLLTLPLIPVRISERGLCWLCKYHLEQVARAVISYHDANRRFPPDASHADGKPALSWRVSILPYLHKDNHWDQKQDQEFYDRFRLNEPWDSPNNRDLIPKQPGEYTCPGDRRERTFNPKTATWEPCYTNYFLVAGSEAAWRGNTHSRQTDPELQSRLSSTVMLIEVADSDAAWTEPRDFNPEDLQSPLLSSRPPIQALHQYNNGYFYESTSMINVALADGSVHGLPMAHLTSQKLRELLAVGGWNEAEVQRLLDESLRLNRAHCIGLSVWLLSAGALFILAVRGRRKAKRLAPESAEATKAKQSNQ